MLYCVLKRNDHDIDPDACVGYWCNCLALAKELQHSPGCRGTIKSVLEGSRFWRFYTSGYLYLPEPFFYARFPALEGVL
jgi:hypothetical protein